MMKEAEVLESIKKAETDADTRVKAAKREAEKIAGVAKAEVPKIQAKAMKEAEDYRNRTLARAKNDAEEERRQIVGQWTAKAKKLKMLDGETMMQMFKKALKERFGV